MKKLNKENTVYINKKKANSSTDVHMVLDPNNPSPLTPSQRTQLDELKNLSDEAVRKEAESDPDCEPLDKPGTVE